MTWKPDIDSNEPIFRQISRWYEEQIINGTLVPGSQLPTERKLAKELGVNRSTITMAYDELRSTGLVRSIQGSGTRVSEDLWGVTPRRIPNWQQYTEKGMFRPTYPLRKQIRAASHDPNIINLAKGELSPDLFPTVDIASLLKNMPMTFPLGYSDPKGALPLRQILVDYLNRQYGIQVHPDQILVTSGAQQALHLITQCLLDPGDAIAVESPSYAYSLPLFTSAGLRLFPISMDKDGVIPDDLMNLYYKHKVKMIFIHPTYQNPTTTTLSMERRKQILQISSELRLPLVEDDAYAGLTLDGMSEPPAPLIALDEGENVIYLGSMSKTVAPGLRIGWVVGPLSVIERLADAKEQIDFGTSAIIQQLTASYLSSSVWDQTLNKLKKELTLRRDCMLQSLNQYLLNEMTWNIPYGGYHLWCQTNLNATDSKILEASINNGVLITPGTVYGAEKGFIRLTYARASEEDIEEGIKRFANTIHYLKSLES